MSAYHRRDDHHAQHHQCGSGMTRGTGTLAQNPGADQRGNSTLVSVRRHRADLRLPQRQKETTLSLPRPTRPGAAGPHPRARDERIGDEGQPVEGDLARP
jgi:hypothetical protein